LKSIKVKLGRRSYEIRIGQGLLARAGMWLRDISPSSKAVLITNPVVGGRYLETVKLSLIPQGFQLTVMVVPDGEDQKTLNTAGKLYGEMADNLIERSTPVLALGGGVIGDLAGFVAATYMRGVPLIHIPTTLLAQVDSSIGGKTAVDHGRIKNSIGVFYQPRLVIAVIDTLQSLPRTEVSNGLAEIIKAAAINDPSLFSFLEKNMDALRSHDVAIMEETVARAAAIKVNVVTRDEKDNGLRNTLNFGHTIGHAIESTSHFKIRHGQAIAMGMVAAARIAVQMKKFNKKDLARLKKLLHRAGLPVDIPVLDLALIIKTMEHDKKVVDGKTRFVLPQAIGKVFISNEVSMQMVLQAIESRDEEE
jgi:3-dehydroquinate synthase